MLLPARASSDTFLAAVEEEGLHESGGHLGDDNV